MLIHSGSIVSTPGSTSTCSTPPSGTDLLPGTYRDQPGTFLVDCRRTGCSASAVNAEVAANPGRVIWLDGDLTVDGDIGTAAAPAGER